MAEPLAFMSYARADDAREKGRLTAFRERLENEVELLSGAPFPIFQDRKDLKWGHAWQERIDGVLGDVTFLIPIITPSFFASSFCRDELAKFLKREQRLGRNDLILPVYYVECEVLHDQDLLEEDDLAQVIAARGWADWRDLRHDPLDTPRIGRAFEALGRQIRNVIAPSRSSARRISPGSAAPPPRPAAPPEPTTAHEPPTLIVDAFHRGDHPTIGAAILAARPGTRILVRPGLYREHLTLDKPLEIVGDGEIDDILLEAQTDSAIRFTTTMGRVANLTIRQGPGTNFAAVMIQAGRLVLEDCDISSQGHAAVAVQGAADPRVRRNRIHDGSNAGIYVYENGRGTFEDNEVWGNALAGIEIKTGGNPSLRHNTIHSGKAGGIFIHENAKGTFEDNEVWGNALAGIEIKSGADPVVRRNKIRDNKSCGVHVWDGGKGTLEGNEVWGNALAGIEIKTGDPIIRRNKIRDGKSGGVFFHENAKGTLEDNEVWGNLYAGVEIKTGADPMVRRNKIHDGQQDGVYISQSSKGTLEGNEIWGNAYAGIEIKSGADPVVRRNKIRDGKQSGVYVWEGGLGTLEDNDIWGNGGAGFMVQSGGNPTVRGNRAYGNVFQGVWVGEGGLGTFEKNDLTKNKAGAWGGVAGALEKVVRVGNVEDEVS